MRREEPARFPATARRSSEDDFRRVLFEITCFAAFVIIGQEAPPRIAELSPLAETERVRAFNTRLLERLSSHLERLGVGLDPGKRIEDYVRAGSSPERARHFSERLAHAVDPEQDAALGTMGLRSIEPIVQLTRFVLRRVFGEAPRG
jgi:hypothetical protein